MEKKKYQFGFLRKNWLNKYPIINCINLIKCKVYEILMTSLADKLLSNKIVTLSRTEGMILPPEEKERLYDCIEAQILEGEINNVIVITLSKEAEKTDGSKDCSTYDSEEMYRFPYTEDKELLSKMLKLVKKQSHSYNMNRI